MLKKSFQKVVVFLLNPGPGSSSTEQCEYQEKQQQLREIVVRAESLAKESKLVLRVVPVASKTNDDFANLQAGLKRVCIKEFCKSHYYLPDFASFPVNSEHHRVKCLLKLPEINFLSLRIILCKWDEIAKCARDYKPLSTVLPNFPEHLEYALYQLMSSI